MSQEKAFIKMNQALTEEERGTWNKFRLSMWLRVESLKYEADCNENFPRREEMKDLFNMVSRLPTFQIDGQDCSYGGTVVLDNF